MRIFLYSDNKHTLTRLHEEQEQEQEQDFLDDLLESVADSHVICEEGSHWMTTNPVLTNSLLAHFPDPASPGGLTDYDRLDQSESLTGGDLTYIWGEEGLLANRWSSESGSLFDDLSTSPAFEL